jgi:hypothetical protein
MVAAGRSAAVLGAAAWSFAGAAAAEDRIRGVNLGGWLVLEQCVPAASEFRFVL